MNTMIEMKKERSIVIIEVIESIETIEGIEPIGIMEVIRRE